jgi:microcin C transport system substrate-binding protein
VTNNIRPWERLIAPFARNLEKLGIKLKLRNMDTSLLKKREDEFDYDMTVHWWLAGQIPGNELRNNFSSQSAAEKGSDNLAGVQNPVVDALIERIMQVANHEELVVAARALDRVLLSGYYVVPHFHNNVHRVSYKSSLARPAKLPLYYQSEAWVVQSWWLKAEPVGKQP